MKTKNFSAVMLLASGILLAYISLFLPPPGEIDDSVLYIFAQILIYAGSIFGIEQYISLRLDNSQQTTVNRLKEKTIEIFPKPTN
ncbi:MAG: hypothetical protein MJZ73_04900 [Bacteroidaceae bacterium]|nr:hypothetical protein [Bacteroidaceae bacterium]